MNLAFYWLGVAVVSVVTVGMIGAALIWVYTFALRGRFQTIIFRKSHRRLSIASWHNSKLVSVEAWNADDFPICNRPLFLSYQFGRRRVFFLAGTLGESRHMSIYGKHPDTRS